MLLKHLKLTNFRNFTNKTFIFSPHLNIIIGSNASGKTTIAECIFLLATGKSFRADRDIEVISFGEQLCRINGEIAKLLTKEEIKLEAVVTSGEVMKVKTPLKKFLVNGVAKRMQDFAGLLKVVLFWPEDLQLVTDSPSLRRRYLDFVLVQVDREYRRTLISYERGLTQRNKLLEAIREKGAHRHQLLFWDQLLIKSGEYITKKREEYIDYINRTQNLELKTANYQLAYDKSIISRVRLDQYSEAEIAASVTLVGPHRDDMIFKIRNPKSEIRTEEMRDLSHFGSRGEQRLAILWLKLGELSFIEKTSEQRPILLLDDILSELDHDHRRIIFEILGSQQTIMTTTDKHFLPADFVKKAEVIELS